MKKFCDVFDKEKFLTTFKLSVLLLIIFVVSFLIPSSFSKFVSKSSSNAKAEVAFYLLKTNYFTKSILLEEIAPKTEPYVYNFTIANFSDNGRAETNIEYELSIRTTTNLPLNYKLFLEQNYNDDGATDIITSRNTYSDSDGTYFTKFTTDKKYFSHTYDETNHYQLVVYFPPTYSDSKYQDIYESVEITVNSKQILDTDT